MKRIISIALVLAMAVAALVMAMPTSAASTPLTFQGGFENVWHAEKLITQLPKTIEATINVPGTKFDIYEGQILDWHSADNTSGHFIWVDTIRKNSTHGDNANNLGIRVIYKNGSTEVQKVFYESLNAHTGKKINIAITFDSDINLYIDGEKYTGPSYFRNAADATAAMTVYNSIDATKLSALNLGGDDRLAESISSLTQINNYRYFKGGIYNAAVFSDVRTDAEIAADKATLPVDVDNLMMAYNTENVGNNKTIADLSGNGYDLVKGIATGLRFKAGMHNLWSAAKQFNALPKTYEVVASFPTAGDAFKGDLFAAYEKNPNENWIIADTWVGDNKLSMRFMLGKCDASGKVTEDCAVRYIGAFEGVRNQKAHVALVVNDTDKSLDLYVNGVKFAGSVTYGGGKFSNMEGAYNYYTAFDPAKMPELTIGGAARTGNYSEATWVDQNPDNFRFYEGKIWNAYIFSDGRTATEIAADMTSVSANTEGLMAGYVTDVSHVATVKPNEIITDITGNGYDMILGYGQGMSFTHGFNNLYVADKALTAVPYTFEATIRVPERPGEQWKGVIVGADDESYANNSEYFILDIHEPPSPSTEAHIRFLCGKTDANGNETSAKIVFNNALKGYEGKQVNIALVFDKSANTVVLYIDGTKWTGSATYSGNNVTNAATFIAYYNTIKAENLPFATIGGDLRKGNPTSPWAVVRLDNSRYFQGQIYKVSVFSDARTQVEIRGDKKVLPATAEDILFAYDVQGDMGKTTITDKSPNGYNLAKPDYTALNTAITAADAKVENEYTTETWAPFATARTNAKALTGKGTQADVNAALATLNETMDALEAPNYTKLNSAIDAANALVETDYSAADWADIQAALTAAIEKLTSRTQADIVAAATNLNEVKDSKTALNRTDLLAAIEDAESKTETNFTTETWAAFAEALADAQALVNNVTTQDAIDAATEALVAATGELVAPDYTELQAAIDAADDKNEDEFTTESWAAFVEALEIANQALTSNTQATIDAAAEALAAAIDELAAPDYTELNAAIDAAEALDENDYTVEDWAALLEALEIVKGYLTSNTQADIEAAYEGLNDLVAEMVALDRTELEAAIEAAEGKTEADYTADSWSAFAAALADAQAALTSRVQADIDAAAEALEAATAALTPVVPDDNNGGNDDENNGGNGDANNGNGDANTGNNDANNGGNDDANTNTDENTDTAKPEASEDAGETDAQKGGCGSAIAASAVVVSAVLALGAGITFKKKED